VDCTVVETEVGLSSDVVIGGLGVVLEVSPVMTEPVMGIGVVIVVSVVNVAAPTGDVELEGAAPLITNWGLALPESPKTWGKEWISKR
jgi:hypothetical protein